MNFYFLNKGVVMFGLFYHESLQYEEYRYPSWAEGIGWSLAMSSILMIPLTAIITLCRTEGTLKEVKFFKNKLRLPYNNNNNILKGKLLISF